MINKDPVSVTALKAGGYITQEKCPSGKAITIEDGVVKVATKNMKYNQSGFTLIESLIVLSIFLLIASLSIYLIKPHYLLFEKERFISIFTSDILFSQQYAISQQRKLFVYIDPIENDYYVLDTVTNKRIIDREIPASVEICTRNIGKARDRIFHFT